MKILYWTEAFWPHIGGIETITMNSLLALGEKNHEFIVLTARTPSDLPEEDRFHGVPVYRFPFVNALSKPDLKQVILIKNSVEKLLTTFQPDLIHLHISGPAFYYYLQTKDVHPSPTVITLHASFAGFNGGENTIFGQTLRKVDWVVGVSKYVLADALQVLPDIVDHSSIIYNGLRNPEVEPLPLPFSSPKILCLGRLVKEKGIDLTIRAFQQVVHRFSQARLVVVGDGPAKNELIEKAIALNLNGHIDFLGTVPHESIYSIINTATVLVIPSRYMDAFPLVALEAAQMGRPIVATRMGGLPESIKHKKTGILVNNEDIQGLADAIIYLLERPGIAIQMGQAGRLQVQTTFSWEGFIKAYDDLYHSLATNS